MLVTACLLPSALSDLFAQSQDSGKITLADRYGLRVALLDSALSEEELGSIDRLLHAIRRGRVEVVDELSVILSLN
ncbi:MAG: hypothetical protein KME12_20695 [Trichocoleus desertorum ATA4-8-CV12]|nr:hypothetical protein [Trichocoleus desertorum ATA4-8-CV12]